MIQNGSIKNKSALVQIMALHRTAIIWTNDASFYWLICALLNDLRPVSEEELEQTKRR